MARQLAREIIFAIGDNMQEGLEPLLTRTLAPSLYQVYLHADDYDRLRTIFPQIEEEARLHLDQLLEQLNRQSVPVGQKVRDRLPAALGGGGGKAAEEGESTHQHVPADGTWHVRFQEDPNEQLEPGEVEVVSELAVGDVPDYGGGSSTQRIAVSTTRRLGQSASLRREVTPATGTGPVSLPAPKSDAPPSAPPAPLAATSTGATATATEEGAGLPPVPPVPPPPPGASEAPTGPVDPTAPTLVRPGLKYDFDVVLTWSDEAGDHSFVVDQDEVAIGRGAVDVWVDVRLQSKADVSRRHFLLRREPEASGSGRQTTYRFTIVDLSQFGTWVNGTRLQRDRETEIRPGVELDLAGVQRMRLLAEPKSESP